MISIITATYNAERDLPLLISSLRRQSSRHFKWIIADGGSTDSTLKIIDDNHDLIYKLLSGPDFGIYDALNKAIEHVDTDYYLTLGADDLLDPNAVEGYCNALKHTDADFITALVRTSEGEMLVPNRGNEFRYGHLAYVSQHAVGTLIKKNLHSIVGQYSRRYPIAADRYFILKAIKYHNSKVHAEKFVAGTYSCAGTSNIYFYDALLDIYKVDFALTRHPLLTAITNWLRYGTRLYRMTRD